MKHGKGGHLNLIYLFDDPAGKVQIENRNWKFFNHWSWFVEEEPWQDLLHLSNTKNFYLNIFSAWSDQDHIYLREVLSNFDYPTFLLFIKMFNLNFGIENLNFIKVRNIKQL